MKISPHYISDAGKKYFSRYSQGRRGTDDFLGDVINAEVFLRHLPPHARILDFGCGSGGVISHLRKCGYTADGMEVNPAAIEVARASGSLIWESIEAIPDSAYDVVISNHVLEHVENPIEVLRLLLRVLKTGGLILLKLPIDDFRAKGQRSWRQQDTDHHFYTWSPRLLANSLWEAGYKVKQVEILRRAWHPRVFPLLRTPLKGITMYALAVGLHRLQLLAIAEKP